MLRKGLILSFSDRATAAERVADMEIVGLSSQPNLGPMVVVQNCRIEYRPNQSRKKPLQQSPTNLRAESSKLRHLLIPIIRDLQNTKQQVSFLRFDLFRRTSVFSTNSARSFSKTFETKQIFFCIDENFLQRCGSISASIHLLPLTERNRRTSN